MFKIKRTLVTGDLGCETDGSSSMSRCENGVSGDLLDVVGHHDGGEDGEPMVDVETTVVVVGVYASDLDLITRAALLVFSVVRLTNLS